MAKAILEDKEFRLFLNNVRNKLSNPKRSIAAAYGIFGYKDIIEHFRKEESPSGTWKPLKSRRGKPLQDTGYLRNSILASNYQSIDNQSIKVFANAGYSGFHDQGTKRIPKREFMWLSDKALTNMVKMIMDQVVK